MDSCNATAAAEPEWQGKTELLSSLKKKVSREQSTFILKLSQCMQLDKPFSAVSHLQKEIVTTWREDNIFAQMSRWNTNS